MPQTSHKTGRELAATTLHKYDLALKRIEDAGLDLQNAKDVIAWVKSKSDTVGGQKVYYSAIKYHLAKPPFVFPEEYQTEIARLYGIQNEGEKNQTLTERQVPNYVPYEELLNVQKRLAAKENKSDADWRDYLIASLYTLTPPVRADYGNVRIMKKRSDKHTGNALVWGLKKGDYFIFKEYKTSGTYGTVEVRVPPALHSVIEEWFAHLGKVPSTLLGRVVTPNDLLGDIDHAFRSTKKKIGINLLRHAYIKHHFPQLKTIREKEELALKMLHSKDKQEEYNSQNV
jgi:hypothetical protein